MTIQVFPPAKPRMAEWLDKVPVVNRQDYTEALLIKDISPRASAVLARWCLQGMRLVEKWYIIAPKEEELPRMIIEMAKMMRETQEKDGSK